MDIVSKHLAANMNTPFKDLDGQRYKDMMEFMRALSAVGFNDEFDNSHVMRTIWKKLEEIEKKTQRDSNIHFTTKLQANPVHQFDLIVTMHSSLRNDVTATMVLFQRDDRIAVSSNVITEEVKPAKSDLPAGGTYVYWFEAEILFKANQKFDKKAFSAFKAVYKALAPKGDDTACRLYLVPLATGVQVTYKVHGAAVLTTMFHYNK